LSKVALTFYNASCAHCVRIVTRALGSENGVTSIEVDSAMGRLIVGFDAGRTSVESIRGLMERSGYSTQAVASVMPLPQAGVLDLRKAA
jgi:copper chaperone CopZ